MIPRLAVLDDEPRMAEVLAMVLRADGHTVTAFTRPADLLDALAAEPFDLLLTDLKMAGIDGLEVLRRSRALDAALPVILVTAHATVATAIAAMREGAFDYIEKPVDNEALRHLVRRALEHTRLARENRALRETLRERYSLDGFIAESAAMQAVVDLVRRAARSRATVLVTGPSGTGKELVARAVHVYSDRLAGPFVAANCKAFAPGVLESELFGHEKGAFTGALQARAGVFERAAGGTLFLDEIGEVDDSFQAKLLRVLQEREVLRVGGTTARPVDVRVVAATQRDLPAEVAAGRFREDLYYRLAVIPIHLPPLRERPADIIPLARQFLGRFAQELGRPVIGWTDEVERWLLAHDWPGNVRELENAIERAVVLCRGPCIELEDVALAVPRAVGPAAGEEGTLTAALDRATAEAIKRALSEAGGAKQEAARRLGIDRTTLYRLMRRLGLAGSDPDG